MTLSSGYNAASGFESGSDGPGYARYVPQAELDSFKTLNTAPPTIQQQVSKVAGSFTDNMLSGGNLQKTPLSTLTGRNHMASASSLNTKVGTLASGGNAAANIKAGATTQGLKADINQAKGAFEQDLKQTQATVRTAMNQAIENTPGIDPKEAARSFDPAPKTTTLDAAVMVGTSALTGVVGGAMLAADMKSMAGKNLSPEQEAKLADQIRVQLTPTRDSLTGEITNPPAIANNFDQDVLAQTKDQELIKLFKEVMRPADQQPEGQAFNDMEKKLDQGMAIHNENSYVNETVLAATQSGGGDVADIDVSDVKIGSGAIAYIENPHGAQVDMSNIPFEKTKIVSAVSQELADIRKAPDAALEIKPPSGAEVNPSAMA